MRRRFLALFSIALAGVLLLAACAKPAGPPAYDPSAAHSEGYWYSRYNLGHLVMMSGMGVQLMPPMEMVQQMMGMAGISEGPANPYLVQALYSSGDPHLITEFDGDPNNFSNFRWDQAQMDKTVTPQSMGYTMIKEVIWAKSFASDVEGPDPMNHFRALVLSTEAAAQANFMMTNLKASNGLFVHGWKEGSVSDAALTPQDQLVMLWALSELADYASGRYNWYAAPLSHSQALALADGLLTAIVDQTTVAPGFLLSMTTRDLGIALSALAAYASYTQNEDQRSLVVEELIPSLTAELESRMDDQGKLVADGGYSQAATQGAAINGLIFAFKVTGDASSRDAALNLWGYLETLWDNTASVYAPFPGASSYTYTPRDVADVVAAFNALLHGLDLDVEQRFADFLNGAVNLSGLQIAEGAPTGGGEDEDTIPDPFHAGGEFGQSPVLATEAAYNVASGEWSITNPRFTTSYAMALSNQMMWIGLWVLNPSVPGHGIPETR
ncbi:MAG: hypothetical protein ACE5IE_00480 [Dehalococcoidia bacterium]